MQMRRSRAVEVGGDMADAERTSQTERAMREIRSLVMSGAFAPNARLPETDLAKRLGVSRTPLRQALDRLVAEGILERIPSGGIRVARFDLDDIRDAIELRGVLEGTAARLAAERGADAQVAEELSAVLDDLDDVVGSSGEMDFQAYVPLNRRFHELLARLSGSQIIKREVERVARLPLASPSAFLQGQELIPDFRQSLTRAQRQHRAIFEAILNREGARAEALAREHARLAQENLSFLTKAQPNLAARIPGMALVHANKISNGGGENAKPV